MEFDALLPTCFLLNSDDDEFYDRTQKPSKCRSGENQSIETANSLLDKKDAIVKKMEEKEKMLLDEDKMAQTNEVAEAGDALDAYMTAVSSQLGMNLCRVNLLFFRPCLLTSKYVIQEK